LADHVPGLTQDYRMPLIGIVTGLEHSGTTWLADLIRGHPEISGGFECGVLLANSPAEFPHVTPFYEWMLKARHPSHWAITPEKMEYIVAAPNWDDMYRRIIESSPLFNDRVCNLLDKTPRYLPGLKYIMQKVDAPVIVIYKPVHYQYTSFKKRDFTLDGFIAHYTAYIGGLFEAYKKFGERIMVVMHEDLVRNTTSVLQHVFRFLKVPVPETTHLQDKVFHTPGPVDKNYDLDKALTDVQSLTVVEKEKLSLLSQDDILRKMARKF